MATNDLRVRTIFAVLITACITISCASSDMTALRRYAEDERLPRPGRVIAFDFAATPGDIPTDAVINGHYQEQLRLRQSNKSNWEGSLAI